MSRSLSFLFGSGGFVRSRPYQAAFSLLIFLMGLVAASTSASAATATDAPPAGGGVTDAHISTTSKNIMVMGANTTIYAMTMMFRFIDQSTHPVVNERGGWFTYHYSSMVQVGLWILLPIVMIAIIHATVKGSMQMLLRSMLVYLPVSIIGSVLAVNLVQLLIEITDDVCRVFTSFTVSDLGKLQDILFSDILTYYSDYWVISAILLFLMTCTSISLMVILILREASIYIATLLLPLAFAMLVWPPLSKHLRRLVEFIIILILSKLIIVAAISMAVAGIVGADGGDTTGIALIYPEGSASPHLDEAQEIANAAAASSGAQGDDWDNYVLFMKNAITAIVFLAIASFSPAMLRGIVNFAGAGGEATALLGSALQRQMAGPWVNLAMRWRTMAASVYSTNPNAPGILQSAVALAGGGPQGQGPPPPTHEDAMLTAQGFQRNSHGDWSITDGQLLDAGIAHHNPQLAAQLLAATDPNQVPDFNRIQTAQRAVRMAEELQQAGRGHEIAHMRVDFGEARTVNGVHWDARDYSTIQNTYTGETEVMMDGIDRNTNAVIQQVPPAAMNRIEQDVRAGIAARTYGNMNAPTTVILRAPGQADPARVT